MNGRDVPVKNAASARNGKPKRVHVTGPGTSSRALMNGSFHLGTRIGRAWKARCDALTAHIGGEPSEVQRVLIDRAVRLGLLVEFAWAELLAHGAFDGKTGAPRPALEAVGRAIDREAALLRLLGLGPREKRVPSLDDVLRGKEGSHAD